jgi:uncharacterized NAD(P)/FAD-binding protein YdhS
MTESSTGHASEGPLRVAIVGVGPKGTFALERLLDHAATALGSARLHIDLFEASPVPGAGPVYDPRQPAYLRMNFAAEQLDMWWPAGGVIPVGERLAFPEWLARTERDARGDAYAPRAQVGAYLAEGFASVLRHCPSNVEIALHRANVTRVRRDEHGWSVEAGGEVRVGQSRYEEILLATGHERGSESGFGQAWPHVAPLIPAVFPVQRWLSRERLAPGARIAVRGFALTFLDAALALTEGRGGRFVKLAHPYRLRYEPSAEQAGLILPFSRSGRPMLAKPDPSMVAALPALEEIAESGRRRLLRLDEIDVEAHLLPVLATTAASSLLVADHRRAGDERQVQLTSQILARLRSVVRGARFAQTGDAVGEIERSLAIGCGNRGPDEAWALGHIWRALYPALVTRLSGHPLAPEEWPAFHRLAREMERLAFGPSPLNAAKLLALIDAGVVDLRHVSEGRLESSRDWTSVRSEMGSDAVDAVLDAVLPAPGTGEGGLARALVEGGHARVLDGGRGLEVLYDGSCIGGEGEVTPGLAAIGRATEDSVIGNDTLSRTLHPLADHWARRVVSRAHDAGAPASNVSAASGAVA